MEWMRSLIHGAKDDLLYLDVFAIFVPKIDHGHYRTVKKIENIQS